LLKDLFLTIVFFGLIAVAIVFLDSLSSHELSGKPYVVDGDSLVLNQKKLRLVGIDAPELRQLCWRNRKTWPCGVESRGALRKLVNRGGVTCKTDGVDKYDRWLVECVVGDVSINAEMVKQGWAVAYGRYAAFEKAPRMNKQGIWTGKFDLPQEWREAQRGSLASLLSQESENLVSKLRGIKKHFLW